MRNLIGVLVLLALFAGIYWIAKPQQKASLSTAHEAKKQSLVDISKAKTTVISAEGMTCISCVARIERALQAIEGVAQAEVNFEAKNVKILYDEQKASPEQLAEAISALGYKAMAPNY